ncbi:MAG TPA: hypothetical protein VH678_01840 [Xanthobacteraceae bacterium]
MTSTSNTTKQTDQLIADQPTAAGELTDTQLEIARGGLGSMISEVMKSFGRALQSSGRP